MAENGQTGSIPLGLKYPALVSTRGPEKINSRGNFPEGWEIKKGRIITPEGTVVPLLQDIGTTEEQKAKLRYDRWRLDQVSDRLRVSGGAEGS
jgi:hypothetical protein